MKLAFDFGNRQIVYFSNMCSGLTLGIISRNSVSFSFYFYMGTHFKIIFHIPHCVYYSRKCVHISLIVTGAGYAWYVWHCWLKQDDNAFYYGLPAWGLIPLFFSVTRPAHSSRMPSSYCLLDPSVEFICVPLVYLSHPTESYTMQKHGW